MFSKALTTSAATTSVPSEYLALSRSATSYRSVDLDQACRAARPCQVL